MSVRSLTSLFVLASFAVANAQMTPVKVARPQVGKAAADTSQVLVKVAKGATLDQIARFTGLKPVYQLVSSPDLWVLEGRSVAQANAAIKKLVPSGLVAYAENNQRLDYRKDFVPNDPYFVPNFPSSGWPGQWTLNDTTGSNLDINAAEAWDRSVSGSGVLIGIVDDGFETAHPDLSTNYFAGGSYNFGGGGPSPSNPNPVVVEDNHGTALAGIIAARGNNSVGICGVAYQALWSGNRINFDALTTAQMVDATRYLAVGANPSFRVKNHSYGPVNNFELATSESAAITESVTAGVVHVRSAGNLRETISEDANKLALRNLADSITVSAIDSRGRFADYSAYGACVMVCAPSGALASGTRAILTTDRSANLGFNLTGTADIDQLTDGAYTSIFGTDTDGGTSVATGLVTGTIALGRQANSGMNTRFAKHLLARSSRQIDLTDASTSSDGGWKTNGAGLKFNQNYGFGLLDADQFVNLAKQWFGPTTAASTSIATTVVSTAIPDNLASGLTRTFSVASTTPLEEVTLTVAITHAWRGDIEIFLTSPSGLTSRMCSTNGGDDGDNISWTFCSNAFWGENPAGTWTIKVADRAATDSGTWNSYSVSLRQGSLYRKLAGTIDFGNYVDTAAVPVTLKIYQNSNQALLATHNLSIADLGSYSIDTSISGLVDLELTSPTWLKKRINGVNMNLATVGGQNFSLTNGDVDQDNEVGSSDFDTVVMNFGNSPATPAEGDCDGDDEVGSSDFDVVVANFGLSGD